MVVAYKKALKSFRLSYFLYKKKINSEASFLEIAFKAYVVTKMLKQNINKNRICKKNKKGIWHKKPMIF